MKELSIFIAVLFSTVLDAQSLPDAYHNDILRDVEYQGAYQSYDQIDYIVIEEDCRELYIYDHNTQEELFHPEMHFQDASVKYYTSSEGYVLCNFNPAFDVGNGDIMMITKDTGTWEPLILSEKLENGFYGYFIDWAPLDQDHFIFVSSKWSEEDLMIQRYSISENRLDTLFNMDQGDDPFLGIEYNDQDKYIYRINQKSIAVMDLAGEVIESIELESEIEKYSYRRNQFLLIHTDDVFYTLDARSNTFRVNDFAFNIDTWSNATDSTVMYITRDPVDAVFEANVFTDDILTFRWVYIEEDDFILPNFVDIFNVDGYVSGISMFKSTLNNQIFAVSNLGDKVESYVTYDDITEWYAPSNDFSISITDYSYFLDTTEVIEVNEDSLYYVVDTSIDFTYEIENVSDVDIDQIRVRSNATNMNGCGFLTYDRNLDNLNLNQTGSKLIIRDTLDFIGRSGFHEFCLYAHSAGSRYDSDQSDNQSCIEVPFDSGSWISMVDLDISWYVNYVVTGTPFNPVRLEKFATDTIWKNGKPYLGMVSEIVTEEISNPTNTDFYELLRQHGPKVYRWDETQQKELLVFDFSLVEGELFYPAMSEGIEYLQVTDVEYIKFDDGIPRRQITLRCRNDQNSFDQYSDYIWIEGIGNIYGPLVFGNYCLIDGILSQIRCVSDENGYIWKRFDDCVITSLDDEELESISIFPNPSTYYLEIEGISNQLHWDIIDMAGTSLSKGAELQIDISILASGIYMIKITTDGKEPIYKRFIKI